MGRTEPINPARKVNLLLKIWLYPNVSTFKIIKSIPRISNYRQNYNALRFTFFLIVASEMFVLERIRGKYMNDENYLRILFLLMLIHGLPEIILRKKTVEMGSNYYVHYNKFLLFVFGGFLLTGLVAGLLNFNDQIGHVK
ncbi:MAG: hypothetical protein JSU01_07880 [Bacteroidetes bacterium]|nr:hypothetical protein [Bacteroidota bacterium]